MLENKCEALVLAIREFFREGAVLGEDARRFIDSIFSDPSMEELEELLQDEENCERDAVMDLIFSPDEAFQARLEDLLEKGAYEQKDEDEALRMLASDPPRTVIRFPDAGAEFALAMPREMAAPFLTRLNIRRKLDDRLVHAIGKWPGENTRRAAKVRLRNSRFAMTEKRVRFLRTFLGAFLDRVKPDQAEFFNRFDFLLGVMDEVDDESEMQDFFVERKGALVRDLQRAARMNDLLAKSNMETLMLTGVRSPYIHEADARDRIRWIDDINLAVFGRVDPMPFSMRETVDLGEFHQVEDLDKVINLLS